MKRHKPLIYLANLSHFREGRAVSEAIPLNIGYLAAYLKAYSDQGCMVRLFNLPHELEKAFQEEIPDVFACSNYVWNFQLNYFYLSHYKSLYPQLITVMGGPNYPKLKTQQDEFLRKYSGIDFYVYLEGEMSFCNLIERIVGYDFDLDRIKQDVIKGCHFIHKDEFFAGGECERTKDLGKIPSPYLTGILDGFLEAGFVPMLQSNRGCRFSCAYCNCSDEYYSKLHRFPLDRVLKELDYISQRVKSKSLHIADSNFGIFKEDRDIALKLQENREKAGWPLMVNAATSKVNKERVADCILRLGQAAYFSASLQSFHEPTLKEIKRVNLTFDDYKDIIAKLKENNVPSVCELIIAMPEETSVSHLQGIKTAIDSGIDIVCPYTCMLLKHTALREDPYYGRFEMGRKYRVIPRAFGKYLNNNLVETEEVCVKTSTLSLDEYIYLRGFHFVVSNYYNLRAMKEIVLYLRSQSVSVFDWLAKVHEYIQSDEGRAGRIYADFIKEAQDELWEKEEEVLNYYKQEDNFRKLVEGKAGANLLLKNQAVCLDNLSYFIKLGIKVAFEFFPKLDPDVLRELANFCIALRDKVFDQSQDEINREFSFDVLRWVKADGGCDPDTINKRTRIKFTTTQEQKDILNNYIDLYGNSEDSRGKILARISPELLYRRCDYAKDAQKV